MIKNGDNDVYRTEMARSEYLAAARREAGIDTSDIDFWQNLITQAKNSNAEKSKQYKKITVSENTPRYRGGEYNNILNDFYSYMNSLKQQISEKREETIASAKAAKAELDEWLANNGFYDQGSTAQKKKGELAAEFKQSLDEIDEEYNTKSKEAEDRKLRRLSAIRN